jgi:hypothetical protein
MLSNTAFDGGKKRTPNEGGTEMTSDPITSFAPLPTLDFAINPFLLPALIGALLGLVLVAIIWGILTTKLAHHKGYRGYFWTGFFLWMVGLIYVVGLPLSDEKRLMDMKKQVQISIRAGLRQDR